VVTSGIELAGIMNIMVLLNLIISRYPVFYNLDVIREPRETIKIDVVMDNYTVRSEALGLRILRLLFDILIL